MGIRYQGEFFGVDGTLWRVEILQRNYNGAVGELTFPYEEPLTITWEEKGKEEPVQGSVATLKIESPGDRTYINLYTIEAGYIVLRIYRDNMLYWSGCLDPEFYEEPYERSGMYDVTLTFTDFGILDRIKWDGAGFWTIDEIVKEAIIRADIMCDFAPTSSLLMESGGAVLTESGAPIMLEQSNEPNGQYALMCSTTIDRYTSFDLSAVSVIADNFYDEDGEPRSWLEVLELVLQPFALRIIQRGGLVYVYDINALATGNINGEIKWDGDRSTLSADRVVNTCTVTFSPYNKTDIVDGSLDADEVVVPSGSTPIQYAIEDFNGEQLPGFNITAGSIEKTKLPYKITSGTLYKVDSIYSGNDEAMVVIGRKGNIKSNHGNTYGVLDKAYPSGFYGATAAVDSIVTKPAYIGQRASGGVAHQLKISVQALVDVRFNPYESDGRYNEAGSWSKLQNWANFGYIPASLYLKDEDGNIRYHYDNRKAVMYDGIDAPVNGWTAGEPSRPDTYMLCWYSMSDRKSASGFGGWQTNRQCIGYYRDSLPTIYDKRGDGDFIQPPPVAGYLELHIMNRVYQFDYKREEKNIYELLRWVAIKEPKIQLVDKWGKDIDEKDVEYTGWINRWASEEMSINTEVGTLDEPMPTARGAIVSTSTKDQISQFIRGDVQDCLERLLIGTIYSQYSTRHTKLTGDCEIVPWGIPVFTERNQPEYARFILAGETQDCQAAVSESIWVEALADNWEGLEFED